VKIGGSAGEEEGREGQVREREASFFVPRIKKEGKGGKKKGPHSLFGLEGHGGEEIRHSSTSI